MAARKTFTVDSAPGLNVREAPSRTARVLRILRHGEKAVIDPAAVVPAGWKALRDGGFVMSAYLK